VVPLGEHPLQRWAATIIEHRVVIDDTGVSIALVSRNDGTQTWGPEHTVRVGTSAPRDWGSPVAHASWLSDNRAVSFSESHVPPGELATFSFPVTPTRNPVVAELQLVADGVCWLPNTRFAVRLPAARRSWKSRLRRWLTT
jgi:hypothetical protein